MKIAVAGYGNDVNGFIEKTKSINNEVKVFRNGKGYIR